MEIVSFSLLGGYRAKQGQHIIEKRSVRTLEMEEIKVEYCGKNNVILEIVQVLVVDLRYRSKELVYKDDYKKSQYLNQCPTGRRT